MYIMCSSPLVLLCNGCTYMYLSSVGEGVHKLVSMIRAQHQAWSERLAARASLLQSTISQMEEDTPPTASFPTPPAQQGEAGGTHHSYPASRAPAREHFQEAHPSLSAHQSEGGALHQHSHPSSPLHMDIQEEESSTMHTLPSLSLCQDGGRALHQHSEPSPPSQDEDRASSHHHAPLSQHQAWGGVGHNYPPPTLSSQGGERAENKLPPSLLSHGAGVKEDSPLLIAPGTSASHHDSLSIFTLSTRYDDNYHVYYLSVHVIRVHRWNTVCVC